MVKRLLLLSFFLLTTTKLLADVNSDVAQCLSQGATSANAKTNCVQNAIAQEEKNQATTLYNAYSSFITKTLNGGGIGGTQTSNTARIGSTTSRYMPERLRMPTPTGSTQITPASPPPVSQAPQTTSPLQGGIKYY
jgi:hypothetical protein